VLLRRPPGELDEAGRVVVALEAGRDEPVAEPPGAADRGVGAAADPERRSAALCRDRLDGDSVEREETSREARPRAPEERTQRRHRLVRAGPALRHRHADRLEVLASLPADADAEDEPPTGEVVERGELLRDEAGVAQGQEHDARTDRDPPGPGGEGREGDGDVEDRIPERDVVAGPDRVVADGLRVLGDGAEEAGVGCSPDQLSAALDAEANRHARSAVRTTCRHAFS
jgi:hypothetical protein